MSLSTKCLHPGFSAGLDSACDLFLSAQNWKTAENESEFWVLFFWYIKIHGNYHKIDYNHDTGSKVENFVLIDKNIFSSVVQLKNRNVSSRLASTLNPFSSAWLSSEIPARAHHFYWTSAKTTIFQTHPSTQSFCWRNIRMVPSFTQNFESSSTAHCRYRDSRTTTTGWIMRHLRHKNHSVGKKEFVCSIFFEFGIRQIIGYFHKIIYHYYYHHFEK